MSEDSASPERAPRWLVFSFDYPPNDGGIARLCAEIATGLGSRVPVAVLTQRNDRQGSDVPALRETRVTNRRPWRELAAWWHLLRTERDAPVIVGTWYPEGLLATLALRRSTVILAHGMELLPPRQGWRRPLWAWLQRRVLSRAALVIANSAYTARLVSASAPASRVCAIPLAVDLARFAPGDQAAARRHFGVSNPDLRVVSTVSRLNSYKGHATVLRAMAALPPELRTRLVYLVAGRGEALASLQDEAKRLGVDGQVRWLGFVAEDDLPDLYRASDLFVLCSRESVAAREVEGFGLVFLEAQACGTPVVGARTGGIPDAVHDGEGGWLIEQDDVTALADILRTLVMDPAAFSAQGAAGRARVERTSTWDHYMGQFVAAMTEASISHG